MCWTSVTDLLIFHTPEQPELAVGKIRVDRLPEEVYRTVVDFFGSMILKQEIGPPCLTGPILTGTCRKVDIVILGVR